MVRAVAESHHGEDQQRGDLDHVDRDVHGRRSVHAAVSDPGDAEREDDRDQHHEDRAGIRRAHEVRPERAGQIAEEDAHDAHHHARIDPVVKVRAPADDELRKPRILPRLLVVEERLFREIIRTAGARIELRHLRVTDGRSQTQQKRDDDSDPHRRRRVARGALDRKGEPEEGAGRDERHRIHRQACKAQCCLHFRCFICHKLSLFLCPYIFRFRATSRDMRGPVFLYSQRIFRKGNSKFLSPT